jgi:hypothetical protein
MNNNKKANSSTSLSKTSYNGNLNIKSHSSENAKYKIFKRLKGNDIIIR